MSAASTSISSSCQAQATDQQPTSLSRTWLQGTFAFADQAVVSLASALTTIIVGRACSKEELGVFSFGTALLWRAVGIPMALVWSPYAARAPHLSPRSLQRYAGSAAVIAVILGLVQALALAVAFAGALLASSLYEIPTWIPVLLASMSPLLLTWTLREHARRTCIADFRGQQLLAIDLPIGIVQLAALVALWKYDLLTYSTALLSVAGAAGLSFVWFIAERPRVRIRWRMVRAHFRSHLSFGGWLLAIALAWFVCDLVLRSMLAWFHGIEAVGTYASAYIIVSLINPVVLAATTFSRSLAARMYAAAGRDALRRFAVRGTLLATVAALAVSALLAVFGDQIVAIIFNAAYADRYVVGAVSLGFCLQAVAIPIEAALMALEKGRDLFVVSVLRVATALLVGVPLVQWQSAAGIGWTTAIQSVLVVVVLWALFAAGNED